MSFKFFLILGETLVYLYDQLCNSKPLCQQSETCYIHTRAGNRSGSPNVFF